MFCFFLFLPSPPQLVSFGLSNEMMVTFKDENLMTFRHLFLKGYKDHRLGSYALYTKADVYDHIYYIINRVLTFLDSKQAYPDITGVLMVKMYNFSVCLYFFQYINLQNLTVGNLAYERVDGKYTPLSVCQEFYRNSTINPGNETFDIDPHIDKGTEPQNCSIKTKNVNLIIK